eukprot:CAMPEP_0194043140 /NCGR_PEP_ID=MMETSP0009_2-20130614/14825_1 /TAXON_ID=210454 /ORGANISM="Grammatophora oceanica, Strain CCMP 410" /LENGTH=65 /DNA_ID=CAMNT_0038687257 /DNA_START=59 /DNA_END=254 /DNA_ORIENTATION=+
MGHGDGGVGPCMRLSGTSCGLKGDNIAMERARRLGPDAWANIQEQAVPPTCSNLIATDFGFGIEW